MTLIPNQKNIGFLTYIFHFQAMFSLWIQHENTLKLERYNEK